MGLGTEVYRGCHARIVKTSRWRRSHCTFFLKSLSFLIRGTLGVYGLVWFIRYVISDYDVYGNRREDNTVVHRLLTELITGTKS